MSEDNNKVDRRSVLKGALERIEALQGKLDAMERSKAEPIAIIGVGCRFPGGIDDPESFWRVLRDGVDVIQEIPADRWDIDAYYDPDPKVPGKTHSRWGGYLANIDQFDPQFFGISPREAVSVDPQQRLFLEVTWEALENAAQAPSKLRNSRTGTFVGVTSMEFFLLLNKGIALDAIDAYYGSGNTPNVTAGRVANFLGLQGPTITLDTACSSSLVAVHLACQSLRASECDMALAGGVNVILAPEAYVCLSKFGMLSADGRCKTYDASADGFVRSEGAGAVVLKRLSDAVENKDRIMAVIRGSAVNHNGPSSGLSVPNGLAQQQLIQAALELAAVHPRDVSYIDAHGTGTSLGDPIEIEALGAVFGKDREAERPLRIGSVKTNLGHLEAAAGVASLIKVVLALQHREIPPHLHLKELNPRVPWKELGIVVPTERTDWPKGRDPHIAGVSSFGFSGTNAYAVIGEASDEQVVRTEKDRPYHLLSLSARDDKALDALVERFSSYFSEHPSLSWPSACYSANVGRKHFGHRLTVVAPSLEDAQKKLSTLTARSGSRGAIAASTSRAKVAFLFSGQGAQYVGMGRALYETEPVFRRTLAECAELLRPCLERPLLSVLYPESGVSRELDQTQYTQPALFALEYALAMMWRSWGVEPSVVLGHSVGEYVAACVAGVFSLPDGLKLIAERARLMQALNGGEMAVVFADESRVASAIETRAAEVSIAAVNGPANVVISGRGEVVRAICDELSAEGTDSKRLNVSHAFHSPLMEPMLDEFERVASAVKHGAPRLPLLSNRTGELVRGEEELNGWYWRSHVREPVRFGAGMRALAEQGYRLFLEVGPGSTLLGMGRQSLPDGEQVWLPSLRRGHDDWRQVLETLGALYVEGVDPDWEGFDRPYARRRLALPTYPFQRRRYWSEAVRSGSRGMPASTDSRKTDVVRLMDESNADGLLRELSKGGPFSEDEAKLLPKVLDALIHRHHRQATARSVEDWLYELRWQPKSRSQTASPEDVGAKQAGVWQILADRGGVGRALAESFERHGQRSVLVYADSVPDPEQVLARAFEGAGLVRGIVHLWSLDATEPDTMSLESLEAEQRSGWLGVLRLVQTLVKGNWPSKPPLWLVTRGAVSAGDATKAVAVAQGPVWGLGRSVAVEHPEVWGGLLDLDPEPTDDEVQKLVAELGDAQGEDQIAFREGQRLVARFVRRGLVPSASPVRFPSDATYWITGGLGGLGLQVARWMVEHGARHLVLIGRGGASSPEAREAVAGLEQSGAEIVVAKSDVANESDMTRVWEHTRRSMPPLRGIMHAAGVPGYRPLVQIEPEDFESVLRPKVSGTWILHRLTRQVALDFFVCFSSIASVWGSKGQAHYAAANQFLDVFAHYRRRLGLPALSVDWGAWAGRSMLSEEFETLLSRVGVDTLPPERAIGILGDLLGGDVTQISVAKVDWRTFSAVYQAWGRRPILEHFRVAEAPAAQPASERGGIRKLLLEEPDRRRELITAHLQDEVASVMGLESPSLDQPLMEIGMDSLMAVELGNRVEKLFGVKIPVGSLLAGTSIGRIASSVDQELSRFPEPLPPSAQLQIDAETAHDLLARIDQFSDEEVRSILNTMSEERS